MLKAPVTLEDHSLGPIDAPIILVEYGDYESPDCGRAHPIVMRVHRNFGNHLRFVFRNFPMDQRYPRAESAAQAAEFAGSQGKFWQMHNLLFENQDRLGWTLYEGLAQGLGLSPVALRDAIADGTHKNRVRNDFNGGLQSGVNGTPTFFINGHQHFRPIDFENLVLGIVEVLSTGNKSAGP